MIRGSSAPSAADLEPLLAAAAARYLRLPADRVGLDVPLARLGLDSLGCVELAAELETALAIQIPPDAVGERATIRSLYAALTGGAPADAFDRMRADAALADDLHPRAFSGVESLAAARQVLLTGATGFLGAALLDVLLTRTQARVTCLVRAEPASAGHDERVEFVRGDLTRPSAGLRADEWQRLIGRTDAVCHAGASINWVAGYDALRDVNVLGTREMLRLAADAGASFHFISSVSACYSTAGPRTADEDYDPLAAIDGLHFGYAQSKAVAESLVRQAGARGLRSRIYRPALIAGDSRSGLFNRDDMLSRLIAGCARMGAAPDLDWRLDALPVDNVAASIVALSGAPAGAGTWHLAHPQPRHWRECVLWMRLYGYDVTLVPYREWTSRLPHASAEPDHPLRPLRSFFLDEREDGLTVPELHEQSRATTLNSTRTSAALAHAGVRIAPLDAELMDRYFSAFVAAGTLPAPQSSRPRRTGGIDVRVLAREMTGASTHDIDVQPFPSGHSIISELTAWQSGSACGLFSVRRAGRPPLVLKVGAHADDVRTVGGALARICAPRLAAAYEEYGEGLGSPMGHEREVALYCDTDPVMRAHTPEVTAAHADAATRTWAVLVEDLRGATLLDAVDGPGAWRPEHVDAAVDGIAAIHGAWHARVPEVRRQRWMGPVRTATSARTMTPLWRALADHAAPMFAAWTDAALPRRQQALIDRLDEWRPALDAAPQTLIHNDFNLRNVCLKAEDDGWRLCAFDWELATIGAPVRDLAEFLCFAGPDAVRPARVGGLLDRHAAGFSAAAGVPVDRAAWDLAFRAAIAEVLIDRLSVYAMVHRVRPQRFLPRVLRTWSMLHALFPIHGLAG